MIWMPIALVFAAIVPEALPLTPTPELIDAGFDRVKRMTVPISINDSGPYAFTIDTGADRSVVSDRLAAELMLPAGKQVTMHSVIGTQQIGTVKLASLKLGGNETRAIFAPVLPQRSLGATGFLGTDVLAGRAVLLDFRRNRITLARSSRRAPSASVVDGEEIVVTGRNRFGQLILTDASIDGVKVYAIIDTGAQNTVGNPALRRLLLGTRPGDALHQTELVGVAGGAIPAEIASVPRIQLGGMHLTNMPVAYADAATFRRFKVDRVPAILVGMDVLRLFPQVAVDFGRHEVRFRLS